MARDPGSGSVDRISPRNHTGGEVLILALFANGLALIAYSLVVGL